MGGMPRPFIFICLYLRGSFFPSFKNPYERLLRIAYGSIVHPELSDVRELIHNVPLFIVGLVCVLLIKWCVKELLQLLGARGVEFVGILLDLVDPVKEFLLILDFVALCHQLDFFQVVNVDAEAGSLHVGEELTEG